MKRGALALFLWGKDAGAHRHVPAQERPLHPAPTTDWGNAAGYLDTSYYEKAAQSMWYVTAYRGQHCAGGIEMN